MFVKKKILKIGLIFILICSGIFCGVTLVNYDTRENIVKNQMLSDGYGQDIESQEEAFAEKGISKDDPNYGIPLVVYSMIFFSLAVIAYFKGKNKEVKVDPKNEKLIIFTLLGIGLFLRIGIGLMIEGFSYDVDSFRTWAIGAGRGLENFYLSGGADYPPLYIYILYLIGKLMSIQTLGGYSALLVKLPGILSDMISAYIIYKLAKKYIKPETSILLAVFYIFNPAVFINSTIWGQVDSFFTLIIILAVYLMSENKVVLSTMVFTISILMKPQGIIYLPILFFEVVRKRKIKLVIKMAGIAIGTALIIIIPFSLNQSPSWIFNLYLNTISEYPYASVNAFNFFSLIGANNVDDKTTLFIFSYHAYGMFFIVITTLLSWFIYAKGKDIKTAAVSALIQIVGVFTFAVGMHERYLFPAAALGILAYIYQRDKRFLLISIGLSITIFLNTFQVLCGMDITFKPLCIIASVLNILIFAYLIKTLWDIFVKKDASAKLDLVSNN